MSGEASEHLISDEVKSEVGHHLLKHMASFIAQCAVVLSLIAAWVQLDWPLPATQADVELVNKRVDSLSLVVLLDKKTDIMSELEGNEIVKQMAAPDRRSPYLAIDRHLKQKLDAVERSIDAVERSIRDLEG